MRNRSIYGYDNVLLSFINKEIQRQEDHLDLIASENYTSTRIMELQGSPLTNKYAEGYPLNRYYGGCEFIDDIENISITRVCKLFNCNYANIQPHSGSQANFAVLQALLQPKDIILGMSLNAGGHLTHGAKPNFSSKIYTSIQYGLNINGFIDYDNIFFLTIKKKPKMIIAGFSAYSQIVDWSIIREIADSVNAYLFVDMAHIAGLVATNLYPSPLPYAHVVTTTTHKTLRGPRGGIILSSCNDSLIYKKLDSAVFPGQQGGPLMHIIAAKAICFKEALEPNFKIYQQKVINNAAIMTYILINRGYDIISGGTKNHLFLISLIKNNITGKLAEISLSRANIIVNKNLIINDMFSPKITSGLRIGTSSITTRGFKEKHCKIIANWICDILDNIKNCKNNKILYKISLKIKNICKNMPVYKNK
ncbi:Serine hydroxymethyltransferase [Candidatus Johnevansia muelleri]|uniref:Serine hydroxymethyltransferase n=1 Tax=Candidatus Johnevansia muelleri TaxID=1495769 RepID=A0A078KI75_9GAMM|nr:Serine hydroxymethyltransferase [Candidatus Evansia muelleri]